MNTAIALLEKSLPFSEFDQDTLKQFHSTAREENYSPGDVLYHELSHGDDIYFVVEGNIRISIEVASAYHMLEEIEGGPGELVGEGRFITDGPRPATVTAITQVAVLAWDVNDWKSIATQNPLVGYKMAVFAGQVLFSRSVALKDHLINDIAWGIE